MKNLIGLPQSNICYDKKYLKDIHPLTLSFIGDSVHTLLMRVMNLDSSPYSNNKLHNITAKNVCASKQAIDAKVLLPLLNDEELFIYKKAKNAKTNMLPKNATLMEYHLATAFEAVIGYLYLSAQNDRLQALLSQLYGNLGDNT